MKKHIAILLGLVMVAGTIGGCGKTENANKGGSAEVADSVVSENKSDEKDKKELFEKSVYGAEFYIDINDDDCYWDSESNRSILRMPDYALIVSDWVRSRTDFTNWESVIKDTEEQLFDVLDSNLGMFFNSKSYEVVSQELVTNSNGVEILKVKMNLEYDLEDKYGNFDEEAEEELKNTEVYVCYYKNNRGKVQFFCFEDGGIESVKHHMSNNDSNYTKKLDKKYKENMIETMDTVIDTFKIVEEK